MTIGPAIVLAVLVGIFHTALYLLIRGTGGGATCHCWRSPRSSAHRPVTRSATAWHRPAAHRRLPPDQRIGGRLDQDRADGACRNDRPARRRARWPNERRPRQPARPAPGVAGSREVGGRRPLAAADGHVHARTGRRCVRGRCGRGFNDLARRRRDQAAKLRAMSATPTAPGAQAADDDEPGQNLERSTTITRIASPPRIGPRYERRRQWRARAQAPTRRRARRSRSSRPGTPRGPPRPAAARAVGDRDDGREQDPERDEQDTLGPGEEVEHAVADGILGPDVGRLRPVGPVRWPGRPRRRKHVDGAEEREQDAQCRQVPPQPATHPLHRPRWYGVAAAQSPAGSPRLPRGSAGGRSPRPRRPRRAATRAAVTVHPGPARVR